MTFKSNHNFNSKIIRVFKLMHKHDKERWML